jgi:hypothetical protein
MLNVTPIALVSLLAASGTVVELGGLKSTAPAEWKAVPVSSPMRLKQFTVPGKDGADAELVVFFFGQGQGGDTQANLDRWKKQFEPPAGKTLDQVSKVGTVKLASGQATVLDVHGTYQFKASPMAPGPGEPRPNQRMLAVVLETPKGNHYIKLVGPEKTIEKNKKAFDAWIKAFK